MALSHQETLWHNWPLLGTCWGRGMALSPLHIISFSTTLVSTSSLWFLRPSCEAQRSFPEVPSWSLVWDWSPRRMSYHCIPDCTFTSLTRNIYTGEQPQIFKSMSLPPFLFISSLTLHPRPTCFLPTEHTISAFIPPNLCPVWTSTVVPELGQKWEVANDRRMNK